MDQEGHLRKYTGPYSFSQSKLGSRTSTTITLINAALDKRSNGDPNFTEKTPSNLEPVQAFQMPHHELSASIRTGHSAGHSVHEPQYRLAEADGWLR